MCGGRDICHLGGEWVSWLLGVAVVHLMLSVLWWVASARWLDVRVCLWTALLDRRRVFGIAYWCN